MPIDDSRVRTNAELAKWSGQGVELEIDDAALTNAGARQKWSNYLTVDHELGADKAINAYYWGTRATFTSCVTATDPQVRKTYDLAYNYIRRSR